MKYLIGIIVTVFIIFSLSGIMFGISDGVSSYSKCEFNTYATYYNPGYRLGCELVKKRNFDD